MPVLARTDALRHTLAASSWPLIESGEVDVVIELDDDGLLIADDVFRKVQKLYAADPALGIVSFRIADEHGETQRRHVPRLRATDPMRRGLVTGFLGGGHAFSVPMLEQVGTWAGEFRFGHEESDLAWRALDADWKILYEPDLVLQHPKTSPARHTVYYRFTARNRVWIARRRLPIPLIPVYLGVWIGLTLARTFTHRSEGVVRRLPGGSTDPVRPAQADEVAHRVAHGSAWPASGHLRRPLPWQVRMGLAVVAVSRAGCWRRASLS